VLKDEFGETVGRIHMQRQEFGKLHLTKSRALRAELRGSGSGGDGGGGDDDEDEVDELPLSSVEAETGGSDAPVVGAKRRR
jgi:hypothetical protein